MTDRTLPGWRAGLVPTLCGWLWARCCIAIGFIGSNALSGLLPGTWSPPSTHLGLTSWDGLFYVGIASGWYDGVPAAGARFFPLYPALGRMTAPLFGGREDLALIVIANVAAFAGALVLWRLVQEVVDHSSSPPAAAGPVAQTEEPFVNRLTNSVGNRAAWMVAIAPAAFVLAWAYTEGLALLLIAATLLALHRRALWWTSLFALLSALLRPVGGLLLVPIAVELWRAHPRRPWLPTMAALAAPVIGVVSALGVIAATTGDVWIPLDAQRELRGGFQDPVTRVLEPIGELFRGNFRDVYNLAHMLVLLALFVVAWRKRQPVSWLAYAGVTLLVTLSSQQTDSLGRYAVVVVPFVVVLAQWSDRRWRQVTVATISSIGLMWLTSEALVGRMVP